MVHAESREDDAERAVRCGLALLELGRVLGAEGWRAKTLAGVRPLRQPSGQRCANIEHLLPVEGYKGAHIACLPYDQSTDVLDR